MAWTGFGQRGCEYEAGRERFAGIAFLASLSFLLNPDPSNPSPVLCEDHDVHFLAFSVGSVFFSYFGCVCICEYNTHTSFSFLFLLSSYLFFSLTLSLSSLLFQSSTSVTCSVLVMVSLFSVCLFFVWFLFLRSRLTRLAFRYSFGGIAGRWLAFFFLGSISC